MSAQVDRSDVSIFYYILQQSKEYMVLKSIRYQCFNVSLFMEVQTVRIQIQTVQLLVENSNPLALT